MGDEHVLLKAHAAEVLQLFDAVPVDAVAAAFAGKQRRYEVDAGLDCPRLTWLEGDVDA